MTRFFPVKFWLVLSTTLVSCLMVNSHAHESCQITVQNEEYFIAKLELPYLPQGKFLLHSVGEKQLFLLYRITSLKNHIINLEITSPSLNLYSRTITIPEDSTLDAVINNISFHIDCTGKEDRIGSPYEFSIRKSDGSPFEVAAHPFFGFQMDRLAVKMISEFEPLVDTSTSESNHPEDRDSTEDGELSEVEEEYEERMATQEEMDDEEAEEEEKEFIEPVNLLEEVPSDFTVRAVSSSESSTQSSSDQSAGQPNTPKRKNFDERVNRIIAKWVQTHSDFPYPTEAEKYELLRETKLHRLKQVSDALTNYRKRVLTVGIKGKKLVRYRAKMNAERKRRSHEALKKLREAQREKA